MGDCTIGRHAREAYGPVGAWASCGVARVGSRTQPIFNRSNGWKANRGAGFGNSGLGSVVTHPWLTYLGEAATEGTRQCVVLLKIRYG